MSNTSTQAVRKLLGPFNRVEGDLEVRVEASDGFIRKAWVNSPLFRGFEQILHGKKPDDALVYTPRICGICSVSQSVAAAQALADAQQLTPCTNGRLATNLILAAENLADHLSHFYLFFMPDFARDCYRHEPDFETIQTRFKAQSGTASRQVLPARASFLQLTGLLAGKWPHSLALQPGGSTRSIEAHEKLRILTLINSFRDFLQQVVFGGELDQIIALDTAEQLVDWAAQHPEADLSRFVHLSTALQLERLGRASDRFMSYGAYTLDDEQHLFKRGTWQQQSGALDPAQITEDVSHSWLNAQSEAKHPFHGSTIVDAEQSNGYSWCKAPRLCGRVMEVGALARQMVDGHPLIRNLVASHGGNVHSRVIARLLELARVVPAMEQWARQLTPHEPFCTPSRIPDECQGAGMVEAARGSLGHWIRVRNGRILNYQIIAPTTWNFSPRDSAEQPGALEQALQGTNVHDEAKGAAAIQHIIRSFDPCMVCTVH